MTAAVAESALVPVDSKLRGSATPRIATVRPRGRSQGAAAIRFARDVLDVQLLPWQEHVLRAGLVRAGGRWASRTVGILVGRQNGKTRLVTVRALAGMVLFGERRIVAAAQNRDVALEAWRDALDLADDAGLDVHDVRRTNGQEEFWIGQARYKIVSNTRRGGRGLSADLVILDELREYRDWAGWAALEKTRRARASSQLWAISNEGDDGSVALNALADQGRAAADAGVATDAVWLEWSAPPDVARTDPAGWVASNPALGWLIDPATIASEAAHDDPTVFETEVLCRRVQSLRPWLPPGSWDACADPLVSVPDGAAVVFALDAGPELRHATIGVAYRRPDGRAHVEAVAAFAADGGPVLPRASARLRELAGAWQPSAVAVLARSTSEAAAVRALDGTSGLEDSQGDPCENRAAVLSVSAAELVRATNAFHESAVARTLVHPPDPMTAAHVGAVTGDGILRRRSPAADIDGAVALVLARHALATAPAPAPEPDWVAY
jgi:hypothetical protein